MTALLDYAGTVVANYRYDAYGYIISVTDGAGNSVSSTHVARLNPFRYRGYMYDEETGVYYLRSRYYDPSAGRFINADGFVSTGQGLDGNNMFAYCGNNPIHRYDSTGKLFLSTIGGIAAWKLGALIGGLVAAYVLTDGLIKNPPTPSKTSIPEIETKSGSTSKSVAKSKAIEIGNIKPAKNSLEDIAKKYNIGECVEAAKDLMTHNGNKGNIIKLYFPDAYNGYVCWDRYTNAISENGSHYGYLYEGIVRCNIYPEGLPIVEWIDSFYSAGGTPPIVTIYP